MAIVEMKKVSLLGHRQERERIVDLLHRTGTVELVDVAESDIWPELEPLLELEQTSEAVARIESRLGEVRYCLDFFQRYFPVRKNFVQQLIGNKIEVTGDQFSGAADQFSEVSAVYTTCRDAEERLTKIRNEENRCRNMLEELRPWVGLSLPLEQIRSSVFVEMGLGAVTLLSYPAFKEALAARTADLYLEEVSADKDQIYLFYIFLAADLELVQPLFKEALVSPVTFPDTEGAAAEASLAFEKKFAELVAQRGAILAQVEEMLARRPQLMTLYDHLDNERAKNEAAANMARTQSSFVMEGWVPAPMLESLGKVLQDGTTTAVLVSRDPGPREETPILLHNRAPIGAYEVVTRLYSVPRRDEYDPTPFMAPFFFLFFGICLADVGYGITLSLLAFLLSRKIRLAGMGKQLVNLFFLGGIGSAVVGLLQGGYFGDLLDLPPLWFNPLDDPIRMLIICFILGLVHIYFGMGIQAYRSIKAGRALDALFDQGSWFVLINGLIMMALPFPALSAVARWAAVIGAASLVLTQGRRQKGLLRKIISGVGSLYNITSILGNVLSYSRLLALGLSSAVIASVINVLAMLMAGSIPGFLVMIPILVVGHFFNLMINVLGAYVHTSRLHYVEFFGLFFEGGGKAFRPFGLKTKFVDVVE